MNHRSRIEWISLVLVTVGLALSGSEAEAQTETSFVETISRSGSLAPAINTLEIPGSGDFSVAVTDFGVTGTPVPPVENVYLLITNLDRNEAVASFSSAGEFTASLDAGTHQLTLIAVPEPGALRASIGLRLEQTADAAVIYEDIQVFEGPRIENPTATEFDFAAPAAGQYRFEVTDQAFPAPLSALNTAFIRVGDGSILQSLSGSGSVDLDLLQGDEIRVVAVATRGSESDRSLLTIDVSSAGTVVEAVTEELGDWSDVIREPVSFAAAGEWTLTVADFMNPAALAALTTIVVQSGDLLSAPLQGSGSTVLQASAGDAVLLAAAEAGSVGSAGYRIESAGAAPVLEAVLAFGPEDVSDAGIASLDSTFRIDSAQTITFTVVDFQFPAQFATISALLVSDGEVIASLDAAGSIAVDVVAGNYAVAVVGALPADASGILGLSISGTGGSVLVEEFATGGSAVRTISVTVSSDELLSLSLNDLSFPASFSFLGAALTRGADLIGTAFGSGEFSFDASDGEYQLHIVSTPDDTTGYSTYSASIAPVPRAPELVFESDRASVPAGGDILLTWSSEFADSCVASGGWSGARPIDGSETIQGLANRTEYRLSCTGPGGTAEASVIVTVTAAADVSGGGGLGPLGLIVFVMLSLLRGIRAGSGKRMRCPSPAQAGATRARGG